MSATHTNSKLKQKFQNRIPREWDQNFYIPGISMNNWIIFRFLKYKNRSHKKVISILIPGIQPNHLVKSAIQNYFKVT